MFSTKNSSSTDGDGHEWTGYMLLASCVEKDRYDKFPAILPSQACIYCVKDLPNTLDYMYTRY